jgi:hypothetical protein
MSKIAIKTNVDVKQQHFFQSVSFMVNSIKTTEEGGLIVNRPFFMNTKEEILKPIEVYRNDHTGQIAIQ